jgi:O-antigen/teichoic acid export membrane protein
VGYLLLAGLGAAAVAGAWIAGEFLLELVFGQAYGVGAAALPVILAASTVHALGIMKLHQRLGEGDPWAATLAQVVALVGTLVAGLILVPEYGLLGAATTNLITYVLFTTCLFWRRLGQTGSPLAINDAGAA